MNIAYTEAYIEWRRKSDIYFSSQYLADSPEKIIQTEDGFSIRSRFYSGEKDGYACTMSENELLNSSNEVIFTWRNIDGHGLVSFFKHSNSKHYMIFRIDLYGYSVLEIDSGRTFNYIPSQSFPQGGENFEETFIWVDATYNPKNNLLAVGGCIWACPESILILDFSEPLREQHAETWRDVHEELDPDYELYCHISVDHWDENGELCIIVFNNETDNDEKKRLRCTNPFELDTEN